MQMRRSENCENDIFVNDDEDEGMSLSTEKEWRHEKYYV